MEDIAVYNSFPEVTKKAPLVLRENKDRIKRAVNAGESMLAKIQKVGMSKEVDKEINDLLKKIGETFKYVKKERTEITQILQAISKEFTVSEQDIDPKRSDTACFKLQEYRNDYAKELAQEAAKIEAEKQKEINKNSERTNLGANIQEHVKLKYSNLVLATKQGLRSIFNDITLEGWNEAIKLINDYKEEVTIDLYRGWVYPYTPLHITKEESNQITKDVMLEMLPSLNIDLAKEISDMKQSLSPEYPAKKKELEALESANASEKKRIEKEVREREEKRKTELIEQKKEAEQKAARDAEALKQQAEMDNMFDEVEAKSSGPERTGFKISLTHQKGMLPIMNFWFDKEGKDMAIDVAMRVTVDRMLRFCEKYAHKNDEKIISPYLKYEEEFKIKAK